MAERREDKFISSLEPFIRTDEALMMMQELSGIEARTDFESFESSSAFMEAKFKKLGAVSEVLRFPADGKGRICAWTTPLAFVTRSARLETLSPKSRLVADRSAEPNTAMIGSGYTGPDGISAELVEIESFKDFETKDVSGKIVLSRTLRPGALKTRLLSLGAKGLVSAFTDVKPDPDDKVKWINCWDSESDGWLPTLASRRDNFPGVSISPREGKRLSEEILSSKTIAKITVEGEFYDASLPTVDALIAGGDKEEIVLTGHLFEQGIIDNASGVSIAYFVTRALCEFRDSNPSRGGFKRSVRHFHGQECYSAMALKSLGLRDFKSSLSLICLDMIGIADAPIVLKPGLMASQSFSFFLMKKFLSRVAEIKGVSVRFDREFEINCTILAEPALAALPGFLVTQDNPDWHSSGDRWPLRKPDRKIVESALLAVSAWLSFMLSADYDDMLWLLGEYQKDIGQDLASGKIRDHSIYFEIKEMELKSMLKMVSGENRIKLGTEIDDIMSGLRSSVKEWVFLTPSGTEDEVRAASSLFPRTLIGGTASDACFDAEQLKRIGSPKWSNLQLLLKSWADGHRSISEICRHVLFESGMPANGKLKLAYAIDFFRIYAKQGLAEMNERKDEHSV